MATDIDHHRPERRAALLAAAREVLAEKGLEATKISDIVARAGVAQGTFYLYFPSKLSLIGALTDEMNRQVLGAVRSAIASIPTLYDAVEAAIAAAFQAMEQFQDILGILHSRMGVAEFRAEIRKLDQPILDFLSDILSMGQAVGEVSPLVNVEIAAQLIVGLIEHAGHDCFMPHAIRPTQTYIAEVARFVRMALGIVPPDRKNRVDAIPVPTIP